MSESETGFPQTDHHGDSKNESAGGTPLSDDVLGAELERDIRARVNPMYADVRGTESYERKRLLGEIDRLRSALEECSHQTHGMNTLRLIADRKRRTREQRLASACIRFLDSLNEPPNAAVKPRGAIE